MEKLRTPMDRACELFKLTPERIRQVASWLVITLMTKHECQKCSGHPDGPSILEFIHNEENLKGFTWAERIFMIDVVFNKFQSHEFWGNFCQLMVWEDVKKVCSFDELVEMHIRIMEAEDLRVQNSYDEANELIEKMNQNGGGLLGVFMGNKKTMGEEKVIPMGKPGKA